jgi:hypothetical protein
MLATVKESQASESGARRKHMVHPQPKAEEADGDEREHQEGIADNRPAGEGGHHRSYDPQGRHQDDVHFRMTEEPEQVLPEQRIAPAVPG